MKDASSESAKTLRADVSALQQELEHLCQLAKRSGENKKDRWREVREPSIVVRGK